MSQPDEKRYEVSGFTVEVSRGSWSSVDDQTNDAIGFLKQYEEALTSLRADPDVEDMRLDFRVDLRLDRKNVLAQFDYSPPELVARAGALGLGLVRRLLSVPCGAKSEVGQLSKSPIREVLDAQKWKRTNESAFAIDPHRRDGVSRSEPFGVRPLDSQKRRGAERFAAV